MSFSSEAEAAIKAYIASEPDLRTRAKLHFQWQFQAKPKVIALEYELRDLLELRGEMGFRHREQMRKANLLQKQTLADSQQMDGDQEGQKILSDMLKWIIKSLLFVVLVYPIAELLRAYTDARSLLVINFAYAQWIVAVALVVMLLRVFNTKETDPWKRYGFTFVVFLIFFLQFADEVPLNQQFGSEKISIWSTSAFYSILLAFILGLLNAKSGIDSLSFSWKTLTGSNSPKILFTAMSDEEFTRWMHKNYKQELEIVQKIRDEIAAIPLSVKVVP
jgi:hypothetical protein